MVQGKKTGGWPNRLFGGRVRTSTVVLILVFVALWWAYDTYRPEPEPVQTPAVVPPGFIPDPDYTWVPRARLERPPVTITETVPPSTVTETVAPPPEPSVPPPPFCPPFCPPPPVVPPPPPVAPAPPPPPNGAPLPPEQAPSAQPVTPSATPPPTAQPPGLPGQGAPHR